MLKNADLPDVIPVFPVPGALLLPRSRLPLQIFEPRYVAMLLDVMKTPQRLIGMVQPNPGLAGGSDVLHQIGCAGRLTQFSETEDGRYLITLTGVSRFRIQDEVESFAPYRRAEIRWDGFERDLAPAETDETLNRAAFMGVLERYFAAQGLDADWDTLKEAKNELLINSLSMLLDLPPEDKQALLEAPSPTTRRETLVTLIEFALLQGQNDEGPRLQ